VFNKFTRKFANWKGEVRKDEEVLNELETEYAMNWWLDAQKPYIHQKELEKLENHKLDSNEELDERD